MIKYILTHKYVVAVAVAVLVFLAGLVHFSVEPPDIQVGLVASAQQPDIVLDDTNIQVPQPSPSSPWFYPLIVSCIMIVNIAVNGYFDTKRKNFNQVELEKASLQARVEQLEKEKDETRDRRIADLVEKLEKMSEKD